jgi:hypothetical protein
MLVPDPTTPGDAPDADAPDDEARDENGLTVVQSTRWRALYTSIATMVDVALAEAPTLDEARRRLALLRIDLRMSEAAIAMNWNRPA